MSQTRELHPAANVAIAAVGLPIMVALTMIPVSLIAWFFLWAFGLLPATRLSFLTCWGTATAIGIAWLVAAHVWYFVTGKK